MPSKFKSCNKLSKYLSIKVIMKTFKLLSAIFLLSVITSCSKNSNTVNPVKTGTGTGTGPGTGTGTDTTAGVYAVGYKLDANGNLISTMWKNGVETELSKISESSNTQASGVFVSGNNVYVTQTTYIQGGYSRSQLWKNGAVTDITANAELGDAHGVFVSGNDVYIVGNRVVANRAVATVWKNGVATSMAGGLQSEAQAIFVSGSDVYVAGFISNDADGKTTLPAVWKNGVITMLGLGTGVSYGSANAIYVNGNDVYVGGTMIADNYGLLMPVIWKNSAMTFMSTTTLSDAAGAGGINGIYVSGSDVYVAGYSVNDIARVKVATLWKNGTPSALTIAKVYNDSAADAIVVSGNDVYVSGSVQNGTNITNIAFATIWKNGTPTTLRTATRSEAYSIFVK
jgi:hypothetical protein